MRQLPELKAYIAAMYDVCLICDELEIEPEELLNAFENRLIEKADRFLEDFEESCSMRCSAVAASPNCSLLVAV